MKKFLNIINSIIEFFPIIALIGGIITFSTSLFTNEIKSLVTEDSFITVIITMTTVIDALMITSLSVFGSTKSYSVTLLSKFSALRGKFFSYIYGILIFSTLVFFFSIFADISNNLAKFYLFSILMLLSCFLSYSHICISMFKKNMENFEKDEKNSQKEKEQLLFQLDELKKRLNKLVDLLYEIKNSK